MANTNEHTDEITQDELLDLYNINGLIERHAEKDTLVDELKKAILDSGKLSLPAWRKLRDELREIEELIPHIDLIIKLKTKNDNLQKSASQRDV